MSHPVIPSASPLPAVAAGSVIALTTAAYAELDKYKNVNGGVDHPLYTPQPSYTFPEYSRPEPSTRKADREEDQKARRAEKHDKTKAKIKAGKAEKAAQRKAKLDEIREKVKAESEARGAETASATTDSGEGFFSWAYKKLTSIFSSSTPEEDSKAVVASSGFDEVSSVAATTDKRSLRTRTTDKIKDAGVDPWQVALPTPAARKNFASDTVAELIKICAEKDGKTCEDSIIRSEIDKRLSELTDAEVDSMVGLMRRLQGNPVDQPSPWPSPTRTPTRTATSSATATSSGTSSQTATSSATASQTPSPSVSASVLASVMIDPSPAPGNVTANATEAAVPSPSPANTGGNTPYAMIAGITAGVLLAAGIGICIAARGSEKVRDIVGGAYRS